MTNLTENWPQVEDPIFEIPEPNEQLEVEAAPNTEKEKSPKESLLNVLTDLTKNHPEQDLVFKVLGEQFRVSPIIEVENGEKNDIIEDHIKLNEALKIVGNKVEEIVESKPNIQPDGPTLRAGRKNRGYIKKQDFVQL